jgi:hypothetical protein
MDDPAPPLRRSSPGRALLVALVLVLGGAGVWSGGWSPAEAEAGQVGAATEVVLVVAAITALHVARCAPRPARRRAVGRASLTARRRRWARPLAVGPPGPARAPPRRAG